MRGRIRAALAATALTTLAFAAQAGADATRRTPLLPNLSCLEPANASKAMQDVPPPVLLDGLGHAGLEPDTANPEARAWFAQGVRLIWAFDEVEAVRAFQQAQRLDPTCALCHFGEAWARGPTINLNPRTEELGAARAAARRALALVHSLNRRDRFLVRGQALRTRDGADFSNAAYAAFMEGAALRMPGDDTLQVMAADARMITWDRGAGQPGSLAQRLLERVLARNPDHNGAIHYYIHLTDWIDRQHLAERYADRLGRIAPAASHLVHMPSHTYYGVGRYEDAAAANVAAIAADRTFNAQANPVASDYRFYLNRHNMHFAINSALARGDGATAQAVAGQYRAAYLSGDRIPPASRLLGSALSYAAGLHAPVAEVMAIPEGEDAVDRAMRHYARGEAQARAGDAAAVRAEARALAALREGTAAPQLGRGGAMLAEVVQGVLEGRAAMIERRYGEAAAAYRRAMDTQLRAGFSMDPPLFWYSVRRSLAAALLAGGDARRARAQLHASLRRWPNDPLALYALSLADRQLGDERAAAGNLARAQRVWAGDVTQVPLGRI
ncbi:MAG: hypothetical protein AB7O91_08200 [Sphingomonas sp.]